MTSATDRDWAFAPVTDVAAAVARREVSARELVAGFLARIDRHDGDLGAYVDVYADRALQAASHADQAVVDGDELGPLHGVPVAIKDLHFLAGERITMGTSSWADTVAPLTEHSVARLLEAGAVPLGKTNVPELGTIAHTATELLGPCASPWDLQRNAGGSSGGAAAALAAGLCTVAQASDGGGSIRIPAAVNGLVGLKPARDRISNGPVLGELAFGLATSGAVTRTVADTALLLDVMAGYEPGDPGMAPPPSRPFVDAVGAGVGGPLRFGVCRQTPFTPDGLHSSVRDALQATVRLLEDLGHHVEEVELPVDDALAEATATVWAASLASQPFDPTTYEPVNVHLHRLGTDASAAQLAAAQFQLQLTARAVVGATAHLDAVVLPVVTGPSRPNDAYVGVDGVDVFADQTRWVGLTPLANLTGQPAISLPLHHDDEHGPVGVQLLGRPWGEWELLRIATELEAAAGWLGRRPDRYR